MKFIDALESKRVGRALGILAILLSSLGLWIVFMAPVASRWLQSL